MNLPRLLSQWYRLIRAALVFACVLALSVILLGRLLMPQLSTLTPQLERFLDANTDLHWKIEGLSGEWQHLKPIIRIESLTALLNQTQSSLYSDTRDILLMSEAELQIDLLASLVDLEWRIRQFKANKIQLPLQYVESLGWQLTGLTPSQHEGNFDWIDFYQQMQLVDIRQFDWHMLSPFTNPHVQAYQSNSVQLLFQANKGFRQLEIFQSADTEQATFILQSQGQLAQRDLQLDAYFEADNLNLTPWLLLLDKNRFEAWQADRWSGQVWLNKTANQDWQASVIVNKGSLSALDTSKALENISFRAGLAFSSEQYLTLRWHDFVADWNQQSLNPSSAELVLQGSSEQWHALSIRSPLLDIGQLSQLVNDQRWLTKKSHELINSLNPKGRLRQMELSLPLAKKLNFSGKAILEDVELSAWKSIPGLKQANIYLEASQNKGFVQVGDQAKLSVFFPKVYRQPLIFSKAKAQINWIVENQRLLLDSDTIDFSMLNDPSDYAGRFSLNAKLKPEQAASQISLEIGILNGQGKELPKLLPYTLPAKTLAWLNDTELAAKIVDGGLIFHGSLDKNKKAHRSTQLYLNIADASIQFDRQWSKAEGLDGLFIMNNNYSSMIIPQARFEQLRLKNAMASFEVGGNGSFFSIESPVSGSLQSVINALQHSPLELDFISAMQSWVFTGDLHQAHIQLDVPIGQAQLPSGQTVQPKVDFRTELTGAAVDMHNINLSIHALQGPLRFTSSQGLVSQPLVGELWGEPINIVLGDYQQQENDIAYFPFQLDATSTASTERLSQWLSLPLFSMADGQTAFKMRLENTASGLLLSLDSDLQGLVFDFPGQLKKTLSESAILSLQWQLNQSNQPMIVSIEDRLTAQLNFHKFQLQNGGFYLGDDDGLDKIAANTEWQGLTLSGQLQTADLNEWLDFYQRYASLLQSKIGNEEQHESLDSGEQPDIGFTIRGLKVDQVMAFERPFNDSVIDLLQSNHRWQFVVSSDELAGRISLPEIALLKSTDERDGQQDAFGFTPQQRYFFDLDYLKLKTAENQETLQLSELLNFQQLEPASVAINDLWFEDKSLGSWRFLLSPLASSLHLHDIKAELNGVEISSTINSGLDWSINSEEKHQSHLSIEMHSNKLGELIAVIDDAGTLKAPLTSNSSQLLVDLIWPASPEQFALIDCQGSLGFSFDEGKFLSASSSAEGLLKLVSLVNFDTLIRRMKLNVSGLYSEGLSFEKLSGRLDLSQGKIDFIDQPIHVLSPSSEFLMSGKANLHTSSIDANLIATLPLKANLPWFAALAGGVPMAAGAYIATKFFDKEIDRFSSAVYIVEGSLADPQLRLDKVFNNKNPAQ
ncbi:MAG: DUF3971 domain-containing protein [Pseudomonadales bacterium]|nr:DUF3971 domain-containing protein [Pseudomonadales bacterium]